MDIWRVCSLKFFDENRLKRVSHFLLLPTMTAERCADCSVKQSMHHPDCEYAQTQKFQWIAVLTHQELSYDRMLRELNEAINYWNAVGYAYALYLKYSLFLFYLQVQWSVKVGTDVWDEKNLTYLPFFCRTLDHLFYLLWMKPVFIKFWIETNC